MELERFSKSLEPYLRLVKRQASDSSYRREASRIENLYVQGPERTICANCHSKLSAIPSFRRNAGESATIVEYTICDSCSHINGTRRATAAFIERAYGTSQDEVGVYDTDFYFDTDYSAFVERVASIYQPKAAFLTDALREEGESPDTMRVLDVGSGAGHMVAALSNEGFDALGVEISKAAVSRAHAYGVSDVRLITADNLGRTVRSTDATAISMICLLPHLDHVDEVMVPIMENVKIKYVFQLIPLASISSALSVACGALTARVLSGTHTHLHTHASLSALESRFGIERVASWWFGTDAVSLFEMLKAGCETAAINPGSTHARLELLGVDLLPHLDALQSALDTSRICDQVHTVWKIPRS